MARKVFFSFAFKEDHWRASQVRQIRTVEGNAELSSTEWEAVKCNGDAAVRSWIDEQLEECSCTVVLIGSNTAERPWIRYEVKRSWELKKGLVGIRVHKLLNTHNVTSTAGANPFYETNLDATFLPSAITVFDPPGPDSRTAYHSIADSIEQLVESAILIQNGYG